MAAALVAVAGLAGFAVLPGTPGAGPGLSERGRVCGAYLLQPARLAAYPGVATGPQPGEECPHRADADQPLRLRRRAVRGQGPAVAAGPDDPHGQPPGSGRLLAPELRTRRGRDRQLSRSAASRGRSSHHRAAQRRLRQARARRPECPPGLPLHAGVPRAVGSLRSAGIPVRRLRRARARGCGRAPSPNTTPNSGAAREEWAAGTPASSGTTCSATPGRPTTTTPPSTTSG